MLVLDDGTLIAQAKTILRFLGKAHGYYPKDPLQGAQVDMLIDTFEDLYQASWKPFFAKEGKDEMYKKIFEETLPKMMNELEPFLGDGWLVGNKLSIADFYVGSYYTNVICHEPFPCS